MNLAGRPDDQGGGSLPETRQERGEVIMAILAECPVCHKKHSVKAKACPCGADLDNEKKNKRVRYHIVYRQNGKQVWRSLSAFKDCDPYSVKDAKNVESKFNACRKENKLDVFDVRPEATMTFQQLSEWYLKQDKVQSLKSYDRIKGALDRFNERLGHMLVKDIKAVDIENYQVARKKEGRADATVDQEVGAAKTVVNKAFNNDMVSGRVLRTFKSVHGLLKSGSNERDRVLSVSEADALITDATTHLKPILIAAYETGMRSEEVLGLCWSQVNMKERLINLGETKNGRPRVVPMTSRLCATMKGIVRDIRDNHVFLYKGKPVGNIRGSLTIACERAGIEYGLSKDKFTFHSLRHTVNTDLRRAGVQESVISAILGHVNNTMFGRYNTIDVDDLRQAMSKLEFYRNGIRQNVRQADQVT